MKPGYIIISLFVLFFVTVNLSGCGYSLAGLGSSLPPHMQNVFIPVFQNETYEYGLENIMTQELVATFNRRSGIRVVQRINDADASLEGTIRIYEFVPTLNAQRQVTQYYINITADVKLRDLVNETVFWENRAYRFHEVYRITDGVASIEANRQQAWENAAKDFAESIAGILLEGF
jgi:hypothetical protein